MTPARRLARAVAGLGGIGAFPLAPGTVASAAAVLPGVALLRLGRPALAAAAVAASCGGYAAAKASGEETTDPGWIVVDELAGQLIALMGLGAPSWRGVLAAFALFRLFDIWKPGPVGLFDRRRSALGIMGDDVAAGALAAVVLLAVRQAWPRALA